MTQSPSQALKTGLVTGLWILLAGCSAKGLSPSSKGSSSPKTSSTRSGQNVLDVTNASTGKKIRMAWEGAQEVSQNLSNVSISPDQRGSYRVYCFGNETDCKEADSSIRTVKVGTTSYGDNPVAITGLDFQFAERAAAGFSVDLITAVPYMLGEYSCKGSSACTGYTSQFACEQNAAQGCSWSASRATLWFNDFKKLSYAYDGTNGSLSAATIAQGSSVSCVNGYGYLPPPAMESRTVSGNTYWRGARLLTGFGAVDHGTKTVDNSGDANDHYEFGRLQYGNVYHLGMAPSANGGLFNPTFIPTGYSDGSLSTLPHPSEEIGVGLVSNASSDAVHRISYSQLSSRPSNWQYHVVVGLCIRNSPIKSFFYRTNLFVLKDCSFSSEGCQ